ncbi:hypothetical protein C1I98_27285 [Spongiactinospora gelatinilytica]|uniref:Uncharacterized protein n=1 Tax=Spongiactinospora gelatinilytica TaxID=2666298 RepID=A0A2W2FK40_9ACTN|nr:hypothetical protein [Spongiactinospora gelatinilytica]PZG36052.1 hypothetical protein C1I98_27285 [Spongiactinospora gelatinilytica]
MTELTSAITGYWDTAARAAALDTVRARLESLDERIGRLSRLRGRLAAHAEEIERGLGRVKAG